MGGGKRNMNGYYEIIKCFSEQIWKSKLAGRSKKEAGSSAAPWECWNSPSLIRR